LSGAHEDGGPCLSRDRPLRARFPLASRRRDPSGLYSRGRPRGKRLVSLPGASFPGPRGESSYPRADQRSPVGRGDPRMEIVSPAIFAIPPCGANNLHGSLLPRFRGRSPTNRAILPGEKKTGVTLHRMAARADAGAIVGRKEVHIGEDDDARTVFMKQVEATRALLAEVYPRLVDGRAAATPQDERLATIFGGRRPEDGAIDRSQSAASIHHLVRAVAYPRPGAFSTRRGRKCTIWRTRRYAGPAPLTAAGPGEIVNATGAGVVLACGSGSIEILRDQSPPDPWLEGNDRKRLPAPIPGRGFRES